MHPQRQKEEKKDKDNQFSNYQLFQSYTSFSILGQKEPEKTTLILLTFRTESSVLGDKLLKANRSIAV